MTRFNLRPLGAARTVTGSSYILDLDSDNEAAIRLMVDHGMFQGPDVEHLNLVDYDFDPKTIDVLLLTHAHIDHCGRIPKLVTAGYRGPIICTKPTAELLELILTDSAKVQEIKYRESGEPKMYDQTAVEQALEQVEIIKLNQTYEYQIVDEYTSTTAKSLLKVKVINAGHIMGAVSVIITYGGKTATFSGDIGRSSQEIIYPFDPQPLESDLVVMESLYGGKFHPRKFDVYDDFANKIKQNISRGGNVIVPVFSIQRAQEMVVILNKLIKQKKIQKDVQIYLDSPLAKNVLGVYTSNKFEINKKSLKPYGSLREAIFTANFNVIKKMSQTKQIRKPGGKIILAGSGMCTGGKVLYYLKSLITKDSTLVTFVGFQAEETLGREIVEGAREVTIDRLKFKVNAQIEKFSGFSAHGDQSDLLKWLDRFDQNRLSNVFLTHSEVEQADAFASVINDRDFSVQVPKMLTDYKFVL